MNPTRDSWLVAAAVASMMMARVADAADPPNFAQIVQPYVDQGQFAGASGLVVTRNGIIAFPQVGFADLASRTPMRGNTVFWIASTSKPFQATALMMLVDDGKVKLDDPVTNYLPHFKTSSPITVRMLLNHTHGLSPNYSPTAPRPDSLPLAAFVDELLTRPLRHEPGKAFMYSDAGVSVASRIVEVVSGQSFEAFLDDRLVRPLGMVDTTFIPTPEQVARLATAYYRAPDTGKLAPIPDALAQPRPRAELSDRGRRFAPQGGLFSTGPDLALFVQMFLHNGRLGGRRYLSEWAVAEMTRNQISAEAAATVPQPPGGPDLPMSYGLGWGVGAKGSYSHIGMAMTDMRIDSSREFATIFLPQHAPDAVGLDIYLRLLDAAILHWKQQPR